MQGTMEIRKILGGYVSTGMSSQGPEVPVLQRTSVYSSSGVTPMEMGLQTASRAGVSVFISPLNTWYSWGHESSLVQFYPLNPKRNAVKVVWKLHFKTNKKGVPAKMEA